MNKKFNLAIAIAAFGFFACNSPQEKEESESNTVIDTSEVAKDFTYLSEQFADLRIIRYQVPGFEELTAKQKELLYYLSQAALSGRDIIYDQNYRHNLSIRRTLEAIIKNNPEGIEGNDWEKFMVYTKRVWFSNGIHHHYSSDKIIPEFSKGFFKDAVLSVPVDSLPLNAAETADQLVDRLTPIMFAEDIDNKKVSLDASTDLVANSAVNFYDSEVTQKEVEDYYLNIEKVKENQPECR